MQWASFQISTSKRYFRPVIAFLNVPHQNLLRSRLGVFSLIVGMTRWPGDSLRLVSLR